MEESKIDFSVIVCCYNPDLDKLKRTLISADRQEGVSLEIIISDDGSKENYYNEIKEWCLNNIRNKVIYNFLGENVGTVKNILCATEIAKGSYIKPISSGDYLYSRTTLSEFINVDGDIVFGNGVYYNNDYEMKIYNYHHPIVNKYDKKNTNSIRSLLIYNDWILGASLLYKKEKLIEYLTILINFDIKYCEDLSTALCALDSSKIEYVNRNLVWYEYGTGISTKKNEKNQKSLVEIDQEKFFLHLLPTLYAKKRYIKKIVKLWKIKNKIQKKIYILLFFPSKLFFKFETIFLKNKQISYNLENYYDLFKEDKQ